MSPLRAMSETKPAKESGSELGRRDLLRIVAGVAGANVLGAAAWGGLELLVKTEGTPVWHKSVCRFCGTGCGIQVGMNGGGVNHAPADALRPTQGGVCAEGTQGRAPP